MGRVAPTPHVPTSARLRYTFVALFVASSLAAAWLVRVRPAMNEQPLGIEEFQQTGLLTFSDARPPLLIREHYTGVRGIDAFLRVLVGAFLPGPARFESRIWLHQFHFLLSFSPVLGISLVESARHCRRGNFLVGYTWTWAYLYQTIAGAIALPWYLSSYVLSSAWSDVDWDEPDHNILTFSTEVDQVSAMAILPTVLLGYILPTLIMYLVPFSNLDSLMCFVAFWQTTPIFLDPLMGIIKLLILPRGYTTPRPKFSSGRPDTVYLYRLYAVLTVVAGGAHLYTLYELFISTLPAKTFSLTFMPDSVDALSSTFAGFHNIFQWDWIFVAVQFVLFAVYAVCDLKVAEATTVSPALATFVILLAAVLLGPGCSLALTWWWRETKLVALLADINVRKQEMEKKKLARKKR